MTAGRRSRRWHRLLVPIAAAPLALTSFSGAIYGTILSFNIDAPWLLRLHTGNFGVITLQPFYSPLFLLATVFYSPLIGAVTLLVIASGLPLLRSGRGQAGSSSDPR